MTTNTRKLEGKIAVVTGGSRGLGAAMVERLARDGARVVFNYRSNAEAAEATVNAVRAPGGEAWAVQADLSSLEGIDAFYAGVDARLEEETGATHFDILVTNAGIIPAAPIHETTEEAFDAVFNLNAKGVFFTLQRALTRLRDGGRIINIGTGLTRFSMEPYIAYAATKGAVNVMTQVLAKQLGPRKITVNTLAPGAIDTDVNPWLKTEEGAAFISGVTALGRFGHADDIADALAFLASEDSRWITGQRIEASGGMHL